MMITVKTAAPIGNDRARIELEFASPRPAAGAHHLAAAAYMIAARLEHIAATEGFPFALDVSRARDGIVEFDFADASMGDDIAHEIAIEAASDCGYGPSEG